MFQNTKKNKSIIKDYWKCSECKSFNIGEINICSHCLTKKQDTEIKIQIEDDDFSCFEKKSKGLL